MHGHAPSGEAGTAPASPAFRLALRLARLAAVIGGVVLMGMALATCASVLGRLVMGRPFAGTYELVEICTGIAVLSFFPYTHITRGNVSAEFFTQRAPLWLNRALDLLADILFLGIAAFAFWRVAAGFGESLHSLNRTFILNLPEWAFYGPAALWLLLLVIVGLAVAWDGLTRAFR